MMGVLISCRLLVSMRCFGAVDNRNLKRNRQRMFDSATYGAAVCRK